MCHSVDRWPFLKDPVSENRISIKMTLRRMTFLLDPEGSGVFRKAPGEGVIGDPRVAACGVGRPTARRVLEHESTGQSLGFVRPHQSVAQNELFFISVEGTFIWR